MASRIITAKKLENSPRISENRIRKIFLILGGPVAVLNSSAYLYVCLSSENEKKTVLPKIGRIASKTQDTVYPAPAGRA
ncbi:MAG: hypothetical protein Q4E38_01030 [Eubacteriales bacterium]|nr:hypothetical protein [Eubacteriales bacterium]